MKKMMMILMCAITSSLLAGDIYDLKFTAKTPVIKKATQYYKDFGTKVYKGFVEIVYDEDGSIINPCNGIIYGDFSDGKIYKALTEIKFQQNPPEELPETYSVIQEE